MFEPCLFEVNIGQHARVSDKKHRMICQFLFLIKSVVSYAYMTTYAF